MVSYHIFDLLGAPTCPNSIVGYCGCRLGICHGHHCCTKGVLQSALQLQLYVCRSQWFQLNRSNADIRLFHRSMVCSNVDTAYRILYRWSRTAIPGGAAFYDLARQPGQLRPFQYVALPAIRRNWNSRRPQSWEVLRILVLCVLLLVWVNWTLSSASISMRRLIHASIIRLLPGLYLFVHGLFLDDCGLTFFGSPSTLLLLLGDMDRAREHE